MHISEGRVIPLDVLRETPLPIYEPARGNEHGISSGSPFGRTLCALSNSRCGVPWHNEHAGRGMPRLESWSHFATGDKLVLQC